MASSKVKSAQISIRLTPEERTALEFMAKRDALDYSGFMRQLIRTEAKRRQIPDLGTIRRDTRT